MPVDRSKFESGVRRFFDDFDTWLAGPVTAKIGNASLYYLLTGRAVALSCLDGILQRKTKEIP